MIVYKDAFKDVDERGLPLVMVLDMAATSTSMVVSLPHFFR
jgi:hypothetical protein